MTEDPPVADVLRDAFEAVLDARDFLGLQLSLAQGSIPEEAFEGHALPYLRRQVENQYGPALVHRVRVLAAVLPPGRFDADVVSTMLRCDFTVAQRLIRELRASHP